MSASTLVQKFWNYCKVLCDDGMSYGDYVEQFKLIAADLGDDIVEQNA